MVTILEQQAIEYLTGVLGRAPTTEEIRLAMSSPVPLSNIHNTLNVTNSTFSINDTDNIQEAIDKLDANNGGTLFLNPGTYILTEDIVIPGGVAMYGAARDNVIIDGDGLYGISLLGSEPYNTGTVTIGVGDTEVVGSGTTWTVDMVGQYIMLDGIWYEISAFTDVTHIDIALPYGGLALAGDTYVIATVNFAATLGKVTVMNTVGSGVKLQYSQEAFIDDVIIFDCGIGIEMKDCVFPRIIVSAVECDVNADYNNVWGFKVDFTEFSNSRTGNGFTLVNSGSATIIDSLFGSNTLNGISLTDCRDITFLSNVFPDNGVHGVELVSGNRDIQMISIGPEGNAGDNIRFTANNDRIIVSNSSINTAGGFGVNIVDNTNTDILISSNTFDGNSSGAVDDNGTGTLIRSNIGVADN